MNLFVYSLCAFAFCWIVGDSYVTLGVRIKLHEMKPGGELLVKLLECCACLGFHLGWIAFLLHLAPLPNWWTAALFTCGSNLVLGKFVGLLDSK